MKTFSKLVFMLILGASLLASSQAAELHSDSIRSSRIAAVDYKNRTVLIGNNRYYLAIGIKVHDAGNTLAGIRNLKAGQRIDYKTRINKKTGQVEIREIWIVYI